MALKQEKKKIKKLPRINIAHGSMETDVLVAASMLVLLSRHSCEAPPAQSGSRSAAVKNWAELKTVSTAQWRI